MCSNSVRYLAYIFLSCLIDYLALMISGELGFDERMHDENTQAYYKVAFLVYILFTLIMTVFVTNLLIGKMHRKDKDFILCRCSSRRTVLSSSLGLAVGEIPPLMKQASDNRNRLFYELVAICEVFRYRIIWILRRNDVNDTIAYSHQNLEKKKWHERLAKCLAKRCRSSSDNDNGSEANVDKLLE